MRRTRIGSPCDTPTSGRCHESRTRCVEFGGSGGLGLTRTGIPCDHAHPGARGAACLAGQGPSAALRHGGVDGPSRSGQPRHGGDGCACLGSHAWLGGAPSRCALAQWSEGLEVGSRGLGFTGMPRSARGMSLGARHDTVSSLDALLLFKPALDTALRGLTRGEQCVLDCPVNDARGGSAVASPPASASGRAQFLVCLDDFTQVMARSSKKGSIWEGGASPPVVGMLWNDTPVTASRRAGSGPDGRRGSHQGDADQGHGDVPRGVPCGGQPDSGSLQVGARAWAAGGRGVADAAGAQRHPRRRAHPAQGQEARRWWSRAV